MDCPKCGKSSFDFGKIGFTKVRETRSVGRGGIRRRRCCLECGHLYTTYEVHAFNLVEDMESKEAYKKQITETIEKSRQSILFALDKIFLDL